MIELRDLAMFWEGRAGALRALVSANRLSDSMNAPTIRQAETYEECAREIRAALKTAQDRSEQ